MNTESIHHQTRYEHSRSIEDAEKFRAIDTLVELGALVRVVDLDVYHGRVRDTSVEDSDSAWSVDPGFANGGNDSGNYNINKRPTLYTADQQTASEFAQARLKQIDGRGSDPTISVQSLEIELHKIVADDPDATIMNLSFRASDLTPEQRTQYKEANRALVKLTSLSEGSPVNFNDRYAYNQFLATFEDRDEVGYVSTDAIKRLAKESDVPIEVATQIASAYNTRLYAALAPAALAANLLSSNGEGLCGDFEVDGVYQDVPLNVEYAQRYLRNAHIIGAKQAVWSGTLGRPIDSYSFFDLYKVDGEVSAQHKRAKVAEQLGPVAITISDLHQFEQVRASSVVRILENPYAKPEAIVQAAMEVEGFAEVFAADAGNHEGFTLAEHTETVLRNLDENYANTLPVQLLTPIRLALLVHDIGKPQSFAEGKKHEQKLYTAERAKEFMDKTGIEDSLQTVVLAVIAEGAELAAKVLRSDDPEAVRELQMFAALTLIQATGEYAVDADEATGLMEICKILEVCDGGAYTSMAVTRTQSGAKYRNYPAFDRSFQPATGFGDRLLQPQK